MLILSELTGDFYLADKKEKAENGSGDQDGSTLFVKNIASSVDKDMLSEMFPGSTEIRMPTKHDGSPKGYRLYK